MRHWIPHLCRGWEGFLNLMNSMSKEGVVFPYESILLLERMQEMVSDILKNTKHNLPEDTAELWSMPNNRLTIHKLKNGRLLAVWDHETKIHDTVEELFTSLNFTERDWLKKTWSNR
jgi:hypothetical protein